MKKCSVCGNKTSLLKIMTFDLNEDFYLQCDKCGAELLQEEKVIPYVIILAILGVIIARVVIYYDANVYLMVFGIFTLLFFHIIFIPFKKNQ